MPRLEYTLPDGPLKKGQRGKQDEHSPDEWLALVGATVEVTLSSFDRPSEKGHKRAIHGLALIDTGSAFTGVDEHACRSLGLLATDWAEVVHAGGTTQRPSYSLGIAFPKLGISATFCPEVPSLDLHGGGQPYIALLGRDMLQRMKFLYDGPAGRYIVEYEKNDPPRRGQRLKAR